MEGSIILKGPFVNRINCCPHGYPVIQTRADPLASTAGLSLTQIWAKKTVFVQALSISEMSQDWNVVPQGGIAHDFEGCSGTGCESRSVPSQVMWSQFDVDVFTCLDHDHPCSRVCYGKMGFRMDIFLSSMSLGVSFKRKGGKNEHEMTRRLSH